MTTDDLRTRLANIRAGKTNKPHAWQALEGVLDAVEGERIASALEEDLAVLYQHFRPAPPKRPRTWWEWVALPAVAAAKNGDARPFAHQVEVTADHAESADGHRLHRVPLDLLEAPPEPGRYWPTGEPVAEDHWATWPRTEQIWPTGGLVDLEFGLVENNQETAVYLAGTQPVRLSSRYTQQAAAMGPTTFRTPKDTDGRATVRADVEGGAAAVIMPRRPNHDG